MNRYIHKGGVHWRILVQVVLLQDEDEGAVPYPRQMASVFIDTVDA